MAAALAAKARQPGGLNTIGRDRALALFLQDCDTRYTVLGTDRNVIDLAVALTQRQSLRAYDSVQLATALLANQRLLAAGTPPLLFLSADQDLLDAAQAEGLLTDNPNLHP